MSQLEISLEEPGRLIAGKGKIPDLPPGFAQVRIRHLGVCGTDSHSFHDRQLFFEYPRIPGKMTKKS